MAIRTLSRSDLLMPLMAVSSSPPPAGELSQAPSTDEGLAGKQKAQRERDAEHPLAHGLMRQHLVHQQGSDVGGAREEEKLVDSEGRPEVRASCECKSVALTNTGSIR